jgi:hypothetical protein
MVELNYARNTKGAQAGLSSGINLHHVESLEGAE